MFRKCQKIWQTYPLFLKKKSFKNISKHFLRKFGIFGAFITPFTTKHFLQTFFANILAFSEHLLHNLLL